MHSAITQRFSLKNGYFSLPSTESMVNLKICGVREFRSVIISEAKIAVTKYIFAPVKKRTIKFTFLFILLSLIFSNQVTNCFYCHFNCHFCIVNDWIIHAKCISFLISYHEKIRTTTNTKMTCYNK